MARHSSKKDSKAADEGEMPGILRRSIRKYDHYRRPPFSFWAGFANGMVPFLIFAPEPRKPTMDMARNIYNDWQTVGDDILVAMGQVDAEVSQEKG